MENSNLKNDQEFVNLMGDTFANDFYDFWPLFPEIFSDSSDNTPKSVIGTSHVVEGLESLSLYFSSPDTGNKSNLISFDETAPSSLLGLLEKPSRNMYGLKHEGFESSSNNEVPADNLDSKRVCLLATRSPMQAHDHVRAEQKRRDKMRQLFISLSSVVPGLKKMDKATIIGEAIEYMKELKERVKMLEEEIKKKSTIGSSFSDKSTMKASIKSTYNDMSSAQEIPAVLNLDINAKITKKDVLIKICCKKQKAIYAKIQHQMELLNLDVVDIRIIPFGDSVVDVTILAEMSDDFCMKSEDIVQHFQFGF